MSEFDPYHKWLGIPPKDQPPTHYRLLGLELFETDGDVIDAAAEQRMLFVNQCAMGSHQELSQKLLNELSAARICLLNPKRRAAYDADLKSRLSEAAPPVNPVPDIQPPPPPAQYAQPQYPQPPYPQAPYPQPQYPQVPFPPAQYPPPQQFQPQYPQPPYGQPAYPQPPYPQPPYVPPQYVQPPQVPPEIAPQQAAVRPAAPQAPAAAEVTSKSPAPAVSAPAVSAPKRPAAPVPATQPVSIQIKTTESSGRKPPSPTPNVTLSWKSWQVWAGASGLTFCLILGVLLLRPGSKPKVVASDSSSETETQSIEELESEEKLNLAKEQAAKVKADEVRKAEERAAQEAAEQQAARQKAEAEKASAALVATRTSDNRPVMELPAATVTPPPATNSDSPKPFDATYERTAMDAKQAQEEWAAYLKTPPVIKSGVWEFVLIPPGKFNMGESGAKPVTLTKPLWVGKTEVTQRQWYKSMNTQPWLEGKPPVKEGDDYAASFISWKDAREFCWKLSAQDGFKYRLLTEAEWEYACRAGTQTAFGFGEVEEEIGKYARFADSKGAREEKCPRQVAKLAPNHFGLFDMHGNAWELCLDRFLEDLPGGTDPLITSTNGMRMSARGGCWKDKAPECASSSRTDYDARAKNHYLGLRIAREFNKPESAPPPPIAKNEPAPPIFDATSARTSTEAQEAQRNWAAHYQTETMEKNSAGMDLVLIPPGRFKMGSAMPGPQVPVSFKQPLWVSRTEVTQGQWWYVLLNMPWTEYKKNPFGDDFPVTNISWEDTQRFCDELSRIDGGKYRLLTEAEWEYACRAGTTTHFSFGDDPSQLPDYGWFDENALKQKNEFAHAAGTKLPNPFGLHDFHGNVMEWCEDFYVAKLPGGESPLVKLGEPSRVCRGGWWGVDADSCGSTIRVVRNSQTAKFKSLGFRVAKVFTAK